MTSQDTIEIGDRHRLSVEDFLLLGREGAFGDRRVELIDGEIYYMSPKHRPHARVLTKQLVALHEALKNSGSGLSLLNDISVHLSDHDVPEPDLAITDEAEGEGILPLDAAKLLIEVADSTLAKDLRLKTALYARAGVPEYWVADVRGQVVHQMWSPAGERYAESRQVPFGERIEAATIPKLAVTLPKG